MAKTPPPQKHTDAQLIQKLVAKLAAIDAAAAAATGSCVYTAGTSTHCAELSQSNCTILGGSWDSAEHCKQNPSGTTECQAN
jgi:hypothetical protein